ncbi:MAG: PQQ-binding-like beta-propeller repeat protein [Alphaproteobacteria bacterium]|nr:PQQ-binding-like beta-propeller repeat protein [Alphaproteobacteria bacterium]
MILLALAALAVEGSASDATSEGAVERASRWAPFVRGAGAGGKRFAGDLDRAPAFQWRVRLPGPPLNSASHTERSRPVVAGDEVLVGSAAGRGLYRLSRVDGAVRGVYEASASVESEPLVVDDRVYFADTSGTTWCYALSGEKIWSNRGNAPILTRPTLADGTVFVTNVDDLVVAIDAETGEQKWRYKAKRDLTRVAELALYAAPGALVDGGEVVVGFSSGQLVGLGAEDGSPKWQVDVGEGRYPDLVATPTRAGSDLYVSGYFKPLLALDRESRNVRWRAESGSAFPVAVEDGVVYSPGTDGQLRAFSALTGAEKWAWSSGTTAALTEPQITPAGVLVAASGGSLYLLDPENGRQQWAFDDLQLLEGITATPTVVGRQVLFVTNAGFLYSLVVPKGELRERPSSRGPFKGLP